MVSGPEDVGAGLDPAIKPGFEKGGRMLRTAIGAEVVPRGMETYHADNRSYRKRVVAVSVREQR